MAKVRITVVHEVRQTIIMDWPDDEMKDFNYENALNNADFDPMSNYVVQDEHIIDVKVNGEEHYF